MSPKHKATGLFTAHTKSKKTLRVSEAHVQREIRLNAVRVRTNKAISSEIDVQREIDAAFQSLFDQYNKLIRLFEIAP